jgi:hypothetical protein
MLADALIDLARVLISRDRAHSPTDVRFAPTDGAKADVPEVRVGGRPCFIERP